MLSLSVGGLWAPLPSSFPSQQWGQRSLWEAAPMGLLGSHAQGHFSRADVLVVMETVLQKDSCLEMEMQQIMFIDLTTAQQAKQA